MLHLGLQHAFVSEQVRMHQAQINACMTQKLRDEGNQTGINLRQAVVLQVKEADLGRGSPQLRGNLIFTGLEVFQRYLNDRATHALTRVFR